MPCMPHRPASLPGGTKERSRFWKQSSNRGSHWAPAVAGPRKGEGGGDFRHVQGEDDDDDEEEEEEEEGWVCEYRVDKYKLRTRVSFTRLTIPGCFPLICPPSLPPLPISIPLTLTLPIPLTTCPPSRLLRQMQKMQKV